MPTQTSAEASANEAARQQLGGSSASLSEGSISNQLVRLTLPMLAGFSSMMLASLVDTFYVGQIGTVELAAVTLTFPLIMGLMSLSMGFGIGATSIISRTVGAGNWSVAQRIGTHTLILVLLFSAVIVGFGYAFTEDVFLLLNANEELLPIAIKYTYINLLGVPVLALPMIGGMMLRSFNDVRTPAIIMISGAVIQVIIAPFLIWGIGPWEGFGVYGSAWAFVISRAVVAVYGLGVFRVRGIIRRPGSFASFVESIREVLRLAIPSMVTQLLMPISMYLVMLLVAQYENHVVAGFGVATRIESLAMIVLMALSSSMGPFVGQNYGSQRYDRIQAALKLVYRFSFLYGAVLALFFFFVGADLAYVFRRDPAVVGVAEQFFYIVPITLGVMSISVIASSTFVAFGEPIPSFIMSVTRMFVFLIPLCYLFEFLFGYIGIFFAMAATNVLSGVFAYVWLKRRTNQLLSVEPFDSVQKASNSSTSAA